MESGYLSGWITLFIIFILDAAIAAVPASMAEKKGRDFFTWWFLCLFFWPIGLIAAIIIEPNKAAAEKQALEAGESKKCPKCAELVKKEAVKCRFCQHEFKPTVVGNKDCPSCGQSLLTEAIRCRYCGHTFSRRRA
jgi:predicted RNA-binding Zn-ribbon protein involved in translation (DUF1610 family)